MKNRITGLLKKDVLVYPVLLIKMLFYYYLMDLPEKWWWLTLATFCGFVLFFEVTLLIKNTGMELIFAVSYGILSLVMAADTIYYDYFGQFISINQLGQLEDFLTAGAKTDLFGALSVPWGLLLLIDVPLVAYWHYRRKGVTKGIYKMGLLTAFTAFCLWAGVVSVNRYLDGDFMRINHLEFVTCHVNDIYTTVKGQESKKNIDREEIDWVLEEYVPKAETEKLKGAAKGKNLILIQVESLNTWPIGYFYEGQEITPNLNRLINEDSLYFSRVFSSSGKGNTSDAEFAALNSLYPTVVRECYRMYVNNTYNGLPWLLRERGYETMAFHGYEKEFWNRNIAYPNQGIQTFYSQSELEMTEVSGFGLTDKEMFRQAVDILKEKEEPWFSFMITLTNHIPYELEESMISLKLPIGINVSTVGNYMEAVRYTDEAVGLLIEYLKEAGLYENTMIALYGDHQGLNKDTEAVAMYMEQVLSRPYDYDEMMRVPFLIHIPGLGMAETIDTVGGQIDILPTIANLMDLSLEDNYIFGSDLYNLKREDGYYAPVTYMPVGSFITEDIMFELGRDGSVSGGRVTELFTGKEGSYEKTEQYSDRAHLLIETSKKILDGNLMKERIKR